MLHWYENFLLSNASQITAVESSLRSITYFLPGRFPDSELAGEAIYSALNLLGLYHDSILVRLLSPTPLPRSIGSVARTRAIEAAASSSSSSAPSSAAYNKLQHTPSEHARYTHQFSDTSVAYSRVARALVIIGYTELLTEMLARRKLGEKKAWNVVVGVETVKAALRIALLRLTDYRTTIQPPIPEREVDPAMLEEDRKAALAKLTASNASLSALTAEPSSTSSSLLLPDEAAASDVWRGPRTGLTRPTLASLHQRAHPEAAGASSPLLRPAGSRANRHPLARRSMTGSTSAAELSGSGSDSEETLVDSWTDKDVNDYLLSRTLTPNDVKRPEELVRSLRNGMGVAAEMLWIVRPLLYVLALRRWGRKHKTPFFLSLGSEYLAGLMRVRALTPPGAAGAPSPLANPLLMAMMGDSSVLGLLARLTGGGAKEARPISDVEKEEWARRGRAFWWYILRGPAWAFVYTVRSANVCVGEQAADRLFVCSPKLESLASKTESRPLLGIIGGIVRDYLPLVDDYYYYSST